MRNLQHTSCAPLVYTLKVGALSKEDLPHIFERFYRVDKFHSSGGNSLGLGLAIVKWVAEIHGGSVGVKSTKAKGSVFSVTLPIKAAS